MGMIKKKMCICGHSENMHNLEICFIQQNKEGKIISKHCQSDCDYETKTKICNCKRFREKK